MNYIEINLKKLIVVFVLSKIQEMSQNIRIIYELHLFDYIKGI